MCLLRVYLLMARHVYKESTQVRAGTTLQKINIFCKRKQAELAGWERKYM